jgi:bifunctional ADP-heptose synthase (sugar kinase/adenylyltransferase)
MRELRDFDRSRLESIMASWEGLKIAVVGDYFLDKYLDIDPALAEPSLETGRTAHQVKAVRHSPGAAGTVVNNLAALLERRGKILAAGFTGDDGEGYELRGDLEDLGVDLSHLLTDRGAGRHTPVYLKPRDLSRPGLAGEHDRYDIKNRLPTDSELEERLMASLDELLRKSDALVLMDQVEDDGFGVITPRIRSFLGERLTNRVPILAWADSRRRIGEFRGCIRKMNQFELMGIHHPLPGDSVPDGVLKARLESEEKSSGSKVFVTAGEKGVWVLGSEGPVLVPALLFDGPTDPTGAGDSFTAGAVLALAAGASAVEAALVGTLTASVTVRKLGTTGTASRRELAKAFADWQEIHP